MRLIVPVGVVLIWLFDMLSSLLHGNGVLAEISGVVLVLCGVLIGHMLQRPERVRRS